MVIKISDLIAEFLEKLEIKIVFGIIGSANSHIFDSITKRGYTNIICMHHEQACVMAAGAYYRTNGKISAAIVTAGAGSSNAITGVLSNWADSIPSIIISGQEQSYHLKNYKNLRMYGIQGFNSPQVVSTMTKYANTILDENTVQNELEHAYKTTIGGRQGPVWLDFPFDIQSSMTNSREWELSRPTNNIASNLVIGNIQYVMDALRDCKRPVIWGGHGIRLANAKEEFRNLIDTLKIPTILTWSAIDLLSEDNEYYFGRAGISGQRHANFIVQNSDLIIVIGSRLSLLQAGYNINNLSPHSKMIMVDIDPIESGKYSKIYDKYIQMDCHQFITELHAKSQSEIVPYSFKNDEWLDYCQKMKTDYPLKEVAHVDGGDEYVNSYNFLNDMSNYMRDDQIVVTDMGTALLSGHHSLKLTKNQTMFTSLGLGEMGYGLPGAIGASFAAPNRQVLCLNCDGGMMMNLQELQTIIHHNLPIKIIVFENDGYLMIKHTQKLLFNGSYSGVNNKTGVSTPDFLKIGDAFGFKTFKIDGNSHHLIPHTLTNFFDTMVPSLCVVHMNPEQEFIPKVKGVVQSDGKIMPASLEEMSPLLPYDKILKAMPWGLSERSKEILRP